jgi:hypothetical protein
VSISICIFEDKKHSNFLPLSLSRPVFDLRIGCGTLRSRLLDGLPAGVRSFICREYLAALTREGTPRAPVNEVAGSPTLFVNGRWLALGGERDRILGALGESTIAVKGGYVVAANLPAAAAKELSQYLIRRVSAPAIEQMCDALRAAGTGALTPAKKGSSRSTRAPRGGHEDEHAIGQDHFEEKLPSEIDELIEKHRLRRTVVEDARLLSFPWQLIEFNPDVIADDFARMPVRGQSDDALVYPACMWSIPTMWCWAKRASCAPASFSMPPMDPS